jgi:hypothetical protein
VKVVRKLIIVALIGICFGILGGLVGTETYFRTHSPRQPDPVHGVIYPVYVQDRTPVYVNARKWYWFESPKSGLIYWTLSFASGCGAYVLNKRWGVFK